MNKFFLARSLRNILLLSFLSSCGEVSTESEKGTDPDRWEQDIHQFEVQDNIWGTPDNATLFVGSSTIRLWVTIAKDFYPNKVINRGFGGAQSSDLLQYMNRIVLPYRPINIVYYAGGNDIADGKDPDSAVTNLRIFVERVFDELPETRIYVLSMKPTIARYEQWSILDSANGARKAYADRTKNVYYVDVATVMFDGAGELRRDIFAEDNLHMNATGYALWINVLVDAVKWQ